ncbi:MAG: hypothetical protein U9Q63_00990, partial [Patescibacteria group bacterium]|nr:hypothetical protein [Patescibacteria group bacterium]
FEERNVINEIKSVMLSDILSIQFISGAPVLLKTVGVENQILYTIESLTDNGGFFDQAHLQILNSFKFEDFVYGDEGESINKTLDENIILIEELLE